MGAQMGSGSESDNCPAQKQGMTLLHCTVCRFVAGTRWDTPSYVYHAIFNQYEFEKEVFK